MTPRFTHYLPTILLCRQLLGQAQHCTEPLTVSAKFTSPSSKVRFQSSPSKICLAGLNTHLSLCISLLFLDHVLGRTLAPLHDEVLPGPMIGQMLVEPRVSTCFGRAVTLACNPALASTLWKLKVPLGWLQGHIFSQNWKKIGPKKNHVNSRKIT